MNDSSNSENGTRGGADGGGAGAAPPGGDGGATESQGDDLDLEVEVEAPEGGAEAEAPPSPEQRIAELEAKSKDSYDRYLRAMAELENVRKRARKDMDEARLDARSRVLREMFTVADNLERAAAHAEGAAGDGGGVGGLLEGIRLVMRQFSQAFERCGVTAVAAQPGVAFDPNQHEAVSQVETAEAPAGSVVKVLQTGYRLGERLLRPAMVVVAKPPAPAEAGADGPNGRDPDAP